MKHARPTPVGDPGNLPPMPPWIAARYPETLEDVAFSAGAALGALDLVLGREDIPRALLRDRRALAAAEACAAFAGRPERARELRDEVHLLRPGERPGPAGAIFVLWRQAVRVPLGQRGIAGVRALLPEAVAGSLPVGAGEGRGPVAAAAQVLEAVLAAHPRAEAPALILAEATLARALGWPHLLPLLAPGLKRRDLAARGEALRLACHRAVATGAVRAHRMARDLTRRAAQLRAVAPKLRAKGAGAALALFLAEDALAPGMALAPVIRGTTIPMTDRAARRLCDRLMALDALRELTGRSTFRLYGL